MYADSVCCGLTKYLSSFNPFVVFHISASLLFSQLQKKKGGGGVRAFVFLTRLLSNIILRLISIALLWCQSRGSILIGTSIFF